MAVVGQCSSMKLEGKQHHPLVNMDLAWRSVFFSFSASGITLAKSPMCFFFFLLIKYWVLIPFLLENLCCLVKFAVMSPLKVSKPMMLHFKGWFGINLRFIYFIWRFQGEAGTYSRCWAPVFRVCLGGGEPSKYQGKSLHLESMFGELETLII